MSFRKMIFLMRKTIEQWKICVAFGKYMEITVADGLQLAAKYSSYIVTKLIRICFV